MSADTLYEQLRGHLHYLKLAAVAEQLAPALERAERDRPGYTEFIAGLLETEVDATEQRRLQGPTTRPHRPPTRWGIPIVAPGDFPSSLTPRSASPHGRQPYWRRAPAYSPLWRLC